MRRLLLMVLTVAVLTPGAPAAAQGVITPSSHWGGIMLPDFRERTELGVHVVSFTRFGKEVRPGSDDYTFTPYNDIDETLGFNFVTLSRMRGSRTADDSAVATTGLTRWRRETVLIGMVSDVVPAWVQNDLMHWIGRSIHWPGHERLRPVPRQVGDTPDRVSRGPTKEMPLLEISHELFVRLGAPRDVERGVSPFFAGGGFAVGTIDQELFLHAGAALAELKFGDRLDVAGIRPRSAGVGGMARAGLLAPGYHFRDLTSYYVNLQGVARADVELWRVLTRVELALTSATGFFVAPRTPAQLAMIRERDARPEQVYAAKTPMTERFLSMRVVIGDVTFETYNDVVGGKDKGPTFGAHATFDVHRLERELRRRRNR